MAMPGDSAPQMSENPVPEEAANGLGDNEMSARASIRVFKMLTFIEGWTRSDRSAVEGRGGGCGNENSNSALVRASRYDPGPVISRRKTPSVGREPASWPCIEPRGPDRG